MIVARKAPKPPRHVPPDRLFIRGLDALLVCAVVAFGSFTVWAFTLPTHLEWTVYAEIQIPRSATSGTNPSDVQARLTSAGYRVTDTTFGSDPALYVVPSGDDRFQAWIVGLGQGTGGGLFGDGKFECGYMKGDSWEVQRMGLQTMIERLITDAMIPVDTSGAYFGDYDFACWDTFGIGMGHAFLTFVLVGSVTLWAAYPRPRWMERAEAPKVNTRTR